VRTHKDLVELGEIRLVTSPVGAGALRHIGLALALQDAEETDEQRLKRDHVEVVQLGLEVSDQRGRQRWADVWVSVVCPDPGNRDAMTAAGVPVQWRRTIAVPRR
jgi:hypothetical protein